jgi:single-stranded-DNA-specific exonuclease
LAVLALSIANPGLGFVQAPRPIVQRRRPELSDVAALGALDPLIARLYASRGVRAADELDYGLKCLAPVSLLDQVNAGVALLLAHREHRVTVVGDFDVDGATSSALLLRCLRTFGFRDVDYLVPNRFEFGYGLTPEIVEVAIERAPALIVTVDNGISSAAGVRRAKRAGIDVLITDHHLPGADVPDANVIINPNLLDSQFPSRNLAGVGVAFYLMAALGRTLEKQGFEGAAKIPARYLDLVALGTVADVVPLDHNNRVLVQQGLSRIRAGQTVAGIRALLKEAGREPGRAVSSDLGFAVGPRINAAGRLDDIGVGIECLLTDDDTAAGEHARLLDDINRERREIESTMREQALESVQSIGSMRWPACVCVYEKDWHAGVVGLIAARVRERCHRPVIAFARESASLLKGSARSVPGVHARDLLEAVSGAYPELIARFGGHAMAAGLTIAERDYSKFAAAVAEQTERLYPAADFSGAIVSDGALAQADIARFGGWLHIARALRDAGPWGAGFTEPTWDGDFHVLEQRVVGEKHLKMRVRPAAGGDVVDAIAFNQAGPVYRGVVRLAYRLDVNEYRGVERPQLVVEQIAAVHEHGA